MHLQYCMHLQALQVPMTMHVGDNLAALQGRTFDICVANILQVAIDSLLSAHELQLACLYNPADI